MTKKYLSNLFKTYQKGDAREESYYKHLDLHGNSLKKEKTPDGSKDENVFDIMQGVAVCFMIKFKKKNS